jgi:TusA-related sulfurtransferase
LALNALGPGDVLKVAATDPASEKDFHLFANQSSNRIINFQKEKEAYFYWIEKG